MHSLSSLQPPVHSHGIHCLHRHGWRLTHWCTDCRLHFENHWGKPNDPEFEKAVNSALVLQVFLEIESGELPFPPPATHHQLPPCEWARRNADRVDYPTHDTYAGGILS